MNREQYKRIRNLSNKLNVQAAKEGFTSVEYELLFSKFLQTQGYTPREFYDAESKYKNRIEEDTSNIPSFFLGV